VGTVVFFGMAFATLVTLLVIPAMYRLISGTTHSPGYVEAMLDAELAEQAAEQEAEAKTDKANKNISDVSIVKGVA